MKSKYLEVLAAAPSQSFIIKVIENFQHFNHSGSYFCILFWAQTGTSSTGRSAISVVLDQTADRCSGNMEMN